MFDQSVCLEMYDYVQQNKRPHLEASMFTFICTLTRYVRRPFFIQIVKVLEILLTVKDSNRVHWEVHTWTRRTIPIVKMSRGVTQAYAITVARVSRHGGITVFPVPGKYISSEYRYHVGISASKAEYYANRIRWVSAGEQQYALNSFIVRFYPISLFSTSSWTFSVIVMSGCSVSPRLNFEL